jgi:arabinogalactan endo-1,4-beta-galactosidase
LISAIACLGKRFDDCRGERSEILQLFGNDGVDYIQVQAGVFVYGHIAKADHVLHSGCQIGWYDV